MLLTHRGDKRAAVRLHALIAPRLLAYALEDRLLKDPDTQHLTLSHRRPADDGERDLAGVIVVARDRLRQLVAQLAAIGRPPRRVLAEVQTAPAGGDAWQLSLSASGAILRTGASTGSVTRLRKSATA